jgi:hypothetical protein
MSPRKRKRKIHYGEWKKEFRGRGNMVVERRVFHLLKGDVSLIPWSSKSLLKENF